MIEADIELAPPPFAGAPACWRPVFRRARQRKAPVMFDGDHLRRTLAVRKSLPDADGAARSVRRCLTRMLTPPRKNRRIRPAMTRAHPTAVLVGSTGDGRGLRACRPVAFSVPARPLPPLRCGSIIGDFDPRRRPQRGPRAVAFVPRMCRCPATGARGDAAPSAAPLGLAGHVSHRRSFGGGDEGVGRLRSSPGPIGVFGVPFSTP